MQRRGYTVVYCFIGCRRRRHLARLFLLPLFRGSAVTAVAAVRHAELQTMPRRHHRNKPSPKSQKA